MHDWFLNSRSIDTNTSAAPFTSRTTSQHCPDRETSMTSTTYSTSCNQATLPTQSVRGEPWYPSELPGAPMLSLERERRTFSSQRRPLDRRERGGREGKSFSQAGTHRTELYKGLRSTYTGLRSSHTRLRSAQKGLRSTHTGVTSTTS